MKACKCGTEWSGDIDKCPTCGDNQPQVGTCPGCADGWPLRERLGRLVHIVDDSEYPRAIDCTAPQPTPAEPRIETEPMKPFVAQPEPNPFKGELLKACPNCGQNSALFCKCPTPCICNFQPDGPKEHHPWCPARVEFGAQPEPEACPDAYYRALLLHLERVDREVGALRCTVEAFRNREPASPPSSPGAAQTGEKCPSCGGTDNNPYETEYGVKMRACGRCVIQWVASSPGAPQEQK